jgi:hypothetical protein
MFCWRHTHALPHQLRRLSRAGRLRSTRSSARTQAALLGSLAAMTHSGHGGEVIQ